MRKLVLGLISIIILCSIISLPVARADSKKTTLKLTNGAVYYGEVKDGKPNGKGTMTWSKNKSYSGQWVNGKREGYGKYIAVEKNYEYSEDEGDPTLIIYTGYWKNDKFNGKGIYKRQVFAPIVYGFQYKEQHGEYKDNIFIKGYEKEEWADGKVLKYRDEKVNFSLVAYIENWQDQWGKSLNEIINMGQMSEFTFTKDGKTIKYDSIDNSWSKDKAEIRTIVKPYSKKFDEILNSYLTEQASTYINFEG